MGRATQRAPLVSQWRELLDQAEALSQADDELPGVDSRRDRWLLLAAIVVTAIELAFVSAIVP